MKDLVLLRTPADVTAHVRGLLRTSELRDSAYVAA